LVKLRAWQTLLGLHTWLTQATKKSTYDWIHAAAQEAQGRFLKLLINN
jgi:hypothetical protein